MISLAFLASAALFGQNPFQGGPNPDDCVLTDKQAFLILPPQPAGPGQVATMQWSPSGRYLLMVQVGPKITPALLDQAIKGEQRPESSESLWVWDRQSGRATEMDRLPSGAFLSGFQFIARSEVAIASFSIDVSTGPGQTESTTQSQLLMADLKSGKVNRISMGASPSGSTLLTQLYASPALSKVVVVQTEMKLGPSEPDSIRGHISRAWTIDAQGRSTRGVELGNVSPTRSNWRQAGEVLAIETLSLSEGKIQRGEVFFNVKTGLVVSGYENKELPEKMESLSILRKPANSADRGFQAAWIKSASPSEQPEAMLSGQADEALLAPTSDAVAIRDRGVVTVRMLASIPKELYLQARAAAERTKALAYGKQVGLGLHMFAADNKDRLPSTQEFGDGALGKYLKDKGLNGGFVYLMNGGLVGDIANPAESVMGYVQGPGGYAWVYADGHVKWKTEAPKPPE